jgi:hypothetical protein
LFCKIFAIDISFFAFSICFSLSVSGICIHAHSFILKFAIYLSSSKHDFRGVCRGTSLTTFFFQWLRLGLYNGLKATCLAHPHLRTETDPIFETLCSIEYGTMDKVQKLSNPKCYTPSSELLKINFVVWNETVPNEAGLHFWRTKGNTNPPSSRHFSAYSFYKYFHLPLSFPLLPLCMLCKCCFWISTYRFLSRCYLSLCFASAASGFPLTAFFPVADSLYALQVLLLVSVFWCFFQKM